MDELKSLQKFAELVSSGNKEGYEAYLEELKAKGIITIEGTGTDKEPKVESSPNEEETGLEEVIPWYEKLWRRVFPKKTEEGEEEFYEDVKIPGETSTKESKYTPRLLKGSLLTSIVDEVASKGVRIIKDPIYYGSEKDGFKPQDCLGYGKYDPVVFKEQNVIPSDKGFIGKVIFALTEESGDRVHYCIEDFTIPEDTNLTTFLEETVLDVFKYLPKRDEMLFGSEIVLNKAAIYEDCILYLEIQRIGNLDKFLQESVVRKLKFKFTDDQAKAIQDYIITALRHKIVFTYKECEDISSMINDMIEDYNE